MGTIPDETDAAADPGSDPAGTDAAVGDDGDDGDVTPRSWTRTAVEWGAVLAVAVVFALVLRVFVVQTYYIPSGSMETTLNIRDRIVVDKLSYHLHSVHRGDIVVFARPPKETDLSLTDLVKRVIGLPGEQIASAPNGQILINGKPLSEPWLPPIGRGQLLTPITPQTIPPGTYFVMGDNRNGSSDSRVFGPISRSLIVGRVVVRIWPLGQLHWF